VRPKPLCDPETIWLAMSERCPILPNYHTDKGGRCPRYITCGIQERTKDPRCPARGQK